MATSAQIKAFIDIIGPIAAKVCKERGYGNAQAWTCVAQACCESKYGTANIMKNANAFFGIKANPSWVKAAKYGGLVYSAKTKECYDGKNLTTITDKFRAYKNMEDSVRDYFDLMATSLYKKCLTKDTVKDCITSIKNSGYATAVNYVSTITQIYNANRQRIEQYKVTDDISTVPNTESIIPTKQTDSSTTRPLIKLGSRGENVKYLHSKLFELKYGVDRNSDIFNELTQQCVMHFQKVNGLVVDGKVGPKTWAKIG